MGLDCVVVVEGGGYVENGSIKMIAPNSYSSIIQVVEDGEVTIEVNPLPLPPGCSIEDTPSGASLPIVVDTIPPSIFYEFLDEPSSTNSYFKIRIGFDEKVQGIDIEQLLLRHVELYSMEGN